jgi:hypothetical protein
MSEHEGNFSLRSLFETFTEELEELEDNEYSDNMDNNNVDSDNVDSENEFLSPCTDLNERNISFLHKILEDNDEISGSDSDSYENETELDFESEDNSGDESEEIQFSHNDEFDEIILTLEQKELTACVVIDLINGGFQRCGQKEGTIRPLHNLFGTWEVDRDVIKEVNGNLSKLGVCDLHFQFDNKYLHDPKEKKLKGFETAIIQWRRCISCNKYITFFSREAGCAKHSWHLNGYNIQISCIGQHGCDALRVCRPLCIKAFDDIKNPKSVCCLCYEKLGGHIYQRPGRGKKGTTCITKQLHLSDTSKGLEFLGNWLIDFSQTENEEIKEKILIALVDILIPFATFPYFNKKTFTESTYTNTNTNINSTSTNTLARINLTQLPSLFIIKTLFIESTKKISDKQDLKINNFEELGRTIGNKLWNSRSDITAKKSSLESPQTIQEYYNAFPSFFTSFFSGIIHKLQEKKTEINNRQRRKRKKPLSITTYEQTIKVVTFITSVVIGLAFPSLKLWLSQVLASLSRKPRLLGSLRQLLTICHVTSHTDRHERKLAKARMEKANPTQRLDQRKNIWNLAIIDNIDFKEKSFKFGNIYDVTRGSSHAILRMAFQMQLPIDRIGPEEVIELTADTSLFGMNSKINQILIIFQETLEELLNFKNIHGELSYEKDFDAESIKRIILTKLDYGCLGLSPNVIILEPGTNPNSDDEILRAAKLYKEDFALEDHDFLDIVADEAIFRRLIKGKKNWPNLRPHLGQWHTSKDFCSVLLVLFSSYGLLSLASRLGVRFLDKFEAAVDYRSTSRVLDLLWVAIGIAINIYTTSKKIPFSEIMDGNNNTHICLKVWYLYYRWAGIWKAHRMGMRIGNFDIQKNSLAAAAPLFASAAKSNYTTAIAHYLSTIAAHPQLEEKLNYFSSFKIPRDDDDPYHVCFGFDEALETFSVRYVKQNITRNTIDEKSLRDQIKACQDERDRIDLFLHEYLDIKSVSKTERASKSRKESMWDLVNDLVDLFGRSDPLSHNLFQEYPPTELHHQGVERLIVCYQKGLERIKAVYRQEVLEIECRNTQGRRAVEVVRTKFKDFSEQKKTRRKANKAKLPQDQQNILQASGFNSQVDNLELNNQVRQKRRQTTPEEEKILEELLVYKEELPDTAINEVFSRLSELSSYWTKAKIKAAWRYRKTKS